MGRSVFQVVTTAPPTAWRLDPFSFVARFEHMSHMETVSADDLSEVAEFVALFGEIGAVWYADGVTLDEARQRNAKAIEHRIIAAENRIKAAARVTGETTPAGFSFADEQPRSLGLAGRLRFPQDLGDAERR